jgi:DNA helicase HerA-like ATPase
MSNRTAPGAMPNGNVAQQPAAARRELAGEAARARQSQPFMIGRVASVSVSTVTGVLCPNDVEGAAEASQQLQVGALVRMRTLASHAFGLVTGLRVEADASGPVPTERRVCDIRLVGEIPDIAANDGPPSFARGVSIYPGLGAEIFTTTARELGFVYARPHASNVKIGTIHQDRTLPAFVLTDEMLGKHFAVLGTTGSGKSCSVALILRSVLEKHPAGHTLLLDPHNEYSRAFGDQAEIVSPTNLDFPYWLLNFDEIKSLMVSRRGDTSEAEASILKEAVVEAKRRFQENDDDLNHITVDTPTPYRLGEVLKIIDSTRGELDNPENSVPYLRLMARIEALRADRRLDFMFSGHMVRDNMAEIISQLLRIPVRGKPITILDISGLPAEIVDVVVSVLCRMIFDFAMWSDRADGQPVLLVCEEAHRYAPQDEALGFGPTKMAISRIAKEGRKYGVSLCLVSQRPSELSTSILSQCNTLFALRMSNERDHEYVRNALPDSAHGLIAALPSLRTQEAIAVGEGVTVPMRLRFDDLEERFRPMSGTANFSSAWQNDEQDETFIEKVIDRWRRQLR